MELEETHKRFGNDSDKTKGNWEDSSKESLETSIHAEEMGLTASINNDGNI